MLRVETGLIRGDDLIGRRVDDRHRGTSAVGHVDPVRHAAYRRAEHVGAGVGVDVGGAGYRRHARQRDGQVRGGIGGPRVRGESGPGAELPCVATPDAWWSLCD